MREILVYDLPVRLLHWLLAALLLGAFVVGTTVDDRSAVFVWHAVFGAAAAFLVLLRVAWGLVGSRYARFGSLSLRPRELGRYLAGALGGRGETGAGHNPATSWFALAILLVVLGLAVTGYRMGRGDDSVEGLHEALAWTGAALAAVHVAGVLWHLVRRRENLAASMVHGRKRVNAAAGIPSSRPGAAAVLLALVLGFGVSLVSGVDAGAGRFSLPLLGGPLTVGDAGERAAEGADGDERDDAAAGRAAEEDESERDISKNDTDDD